MAGMDDFRMGRNIFGGFDPVMDDASGGGLFAGDNDVMADHAHRGIRMAAMSSLLAWIESGDHTADNLEAIARYMADMGDETPDDEDYEEIEDSYFSMVMNDMAMAMSAIGGDVENINEFMSDGDAEAGIIMGSFLSSRMEQVKMDNSDMAAAFAVADHGHSDGVGFDSCPKADSDMVLESFKKVIQNGKVKLIKVKPKRKKILSPAQKAGLKKARMKANTGAAKKKRMRSLQKRRKLIG